MSVFMVVTEVTDSGCIGWVYTDTQEALFYGKVFVQDLLTEVGEIWVNNIYPVENNSTVKVKDVLYPCYTVHAKELSAFEQAGSRSPSGSHRRR